MSTAQSTLIVWIKVEALIALLGLHVLCLFNLNLPPNHIKTCLNTKYPTPADLNSYPTMAPKATSPYKTQNVATEPGPSTSNANYAHA
jgi:hypothetical protein